jgi:hypothetical protein
VTHSQFSSPSQIKVSMDRVLACVKQKVDKDGTPKLFSHSTATANPMASSSLLSSATDDSSSSPSDRTLYIAVYFKGDELAHQRSSDVLPNICEGLFSTSPSLLTVLLDPSHLAKHTHHHHSVVRACVTAMLNGKRITFDDAIKTIDQLRFRHVVMSLFSSQSALLSVTTLYLFVSFALLGALSHAEYIGIVHFASKENCASTPSFVSHGISQLLMGLLDCTLHSHCGRYNVFDFGPLLGQADIIWVSKLSASLCRDMHASIMWNSAAPHWMIEKYVPIVDIPEITVKTKCVDFFPGEVTVSLSLLHSDESFSFTVIVNANETVGRVKQLGFQKLSRVLNLDFDVTQYNLYSPELDRVFSDDEKISSYECVFRQLPRSFLALTLLGVEEVKETAKQVILIVLRIISQKNELIFFLFLGRDSS